MGVESSKICSGSVRSSHGTGRTLNAPPQCSASAAHKEPPQVSCGSVLSTDVTITTLSFPPSGFEVVSQQDPIWVLVDHTVTKPVTFAHDRCGSEVQQTTVGNLMDAAKDALCKKAENLDCNAVLGLTVNVSTHSSGELGSFKNISLTMMGTPCVLSGPSSRTMGGDPGNSATGEESPKSVSGGLEYFQFAISATGGDSPNSVYGGVEDFPFAQSLEHGVPPALWMEAPMSLEQDYMGTPKSREEMVFAKSLEHGVPPALWTEAPKSLEQDYMGAPKSREEVVFAKSLENGVPPPLWMEAPKGLQPVCIGITKSGEEMVWRY